MGALPPFAAPEPAHHLPNLHDLIFPVCQKRASAIPGTCATASNSTGRGFLGSTVEQPLSKAKAPARTNGNQLCIVIFTL